MSYHNPLKVLHIDLSTQKIRLDKRADLHDYLGGVGVAIKLFEENLKPDLDPLHEEQPIVLAHGAATFVFPVITKTVAVFRSPLTGELGETYAGGRLAMTMLMAGYDAMVITGKAAKPSYLAIGNNDVLVKDARPIWGLSSDNSALVIRNNEPGGGMRSIIRIGPAGENLVRFASVNVDTYRHFGRLGLGAVFGSKLLKAISVVRGDRSLPVGNFKDYFKVFRDIFKKVTATEVLAKYHDMGTSINIEPLNAAGGLPTRNLQQTRFEQSDRITGEVFAREKLHRKMACTGCPVGCIHIGQYRHEFGEGYEYEAVSVGYDYELIFALGSYLGIKTPDEILKLIDRVEYYGLDAMSTGVILGWATEAYEKKLISREQTLVPLVFGDTENYLTAMEHLAWQKNTFYKNLGLGVAKAAEFYGGLDFAMQIGGNEMTGYHTGYGSIVGQAVGARHSHLCNGGYALDQSMKAFDQEKLVEALFSEEKERCLLNSLIICLFARKVYDRPTILSALNSLGYSLTNEDLSEIADRIYRTKLRVKKALGFDLLDLRIPQRMFKTPSMKGVLDAGTAYDLIARFNQKNHDLLKQGPGRQI